jgi:hypothetical protein
LGSPGSMGAMVQQVRFGWFIRFYSVLNLLNRVNF